MFLSTAGQTFSRNERCQRGKHGQRRSGGRERGKLESRGLRNSTKIRAARNSKGTGKQWARTPVPYEFFREFIQRCNCAMRNDISPMNARACYGPSSRLGRGWKGDARDCTLKDNPLPALFRQPVFPETNFPPSGSPLVSPSPPLSLRYRRRGFHREILGRNDASVSTTIRLKSNTLDFI